MRVINICMNDYANFAHDNAMAMRAAGIDAASYCLRKHPYGYARQSELVTRHEMIRQIREADTIQIMHSDLDMVLLLQGINKRVIVYHTGTKYRQNPDYHNAIFNRVAEKTVIALGEFSGLGATNEQYLVGAIDTDRLRPDYLPHRGRLRIRHHPSNAGTKGTATILALMKELRETRKAPFEFIYSDNGSRVSAPENITRMRDCHIYIELFKLKQQDKPYGSFGISALEAAALGRVVVTNHLWQELYMREYGDCALQIANTGDGFIATLTRLIEMSPEEILALQIRTRQWVTDKHGHLATGIKIKEDVLCI